MLAYASSSLDASAGNVQLPAVADPIFNRSNSNYQIPVEHWLMFAYLGGVGMTKGRFQAGSLQQRGYPQIAPFSILAIPPSNAQIMDMRDYPLALRREEDLRVSITNGAANPAICLAAVSNERPNYNVNNKDLRIIRGTASVTAAAYAWSTQGSFSPEDTLEGGSYDVYGLAIQGAAVLGGRIIFQGQNYRPGCLGQAAASDKQNQLFWGGLGYFGTFNTYSLPQIETIETGAGASTPNVLLLCGKR